MYSFRSSTYGGATRFTYSPSFSSYAFRNAFIQAGSGGALSGTGAARTPAGRPPAGGAGGSPTPAARSTPPTAARTPITTGTAHFAFGIMILVTSFAS